MDPYDRPLRSPVVVPKKPFAHSPIPYKEPWRRPALTLACGILPGSLLGMEEWVFGIGMGDLKRLS